MLQQQVTRMMWCPMRSFYLDLTHGSAMLNCNQLHPRLLGYWNVPRWAIHKAWRTLTLFTATLWDHLLFFSPRAKWRKLSNFSSKFAPCRFTPKLQSLCTLLLFSIFFPFIPFSPFLLIFQVTQSRLHQRLRADVCHWCGQMTTVPTDNRSIYLCHGNWIS